MARESSEGLLPGAKDAQQYGLSHAFPNGVPIINGQLDAKALTQMYAMHGAYADIPKLADLAQLQQQLPKHRGKRRI